MKENGGYYKYPGGAKKFLYAGSKKDEAAEDQWTFAPKGSASKPAGKAVDLNDVWSIQKNVSLGGNAPRSSDRLTHNASKGLYSRHGGIKDTSRNGVSNPSDKADGSHWAGARGGSISYSYTSGRQNANNDDASSFASSHVSRGYHSNPSPRQRRFDNSHGPPDENDF